LGVPGRLDLLRPVAPNERKDIEQNKKRIDIFLGEGGAS